MQHSRLFVYLLSAWTTTAQVLGQRDDEEAAVAQSYFHESTASGLLYGHVALMLLTWVGCFPVCESRNPPIVFAHDLTSVVIVLELARSRFAFPAQILFLVLNALGTFLGLRYKSKTPDLYPGSAHHAISWMLTGLAFFQLLVKLAQSSLDQRPSKARYDPLRDEAQALVSPLASWNGSDQTLDGRLTSGDASSPERPPWLAGPKAMTNRGCLSVVRRFLLRDSPLAFRGTYRENVTLAKGEFSILRGLLVTSALDKTSLTLSVMLVIFAFVNIDVGVVTMFGIFVRCSSPQNHLLS